MKNPNLKLDIDNPLLSVRQVAELFGCSRRTVGRLEDKGLRAESLADGSTRRYYLKECHRFSRVHFVRATKNKGAAKNARMQRKLQAAG